ncbi:hypothetical protein OQA88_2621 [Cercophora sp. LCS_1]
MWAPTLLGPSDPSTLHATFHLGIVHHRRFQYPEAESYLQQVMTDATTPSTRPTGREASSILGLVYRHLGRHEEALALLDGPRPPFDAALPPRYRRALIVQDLGNWNDALTDYNQVYAGFTDVLGPNHPLTLRTANALGMLYRLMARRAEARAMLETAWKGQQELGFSQENETAQLRTDYNLAALDRDEGRYTEALQRLERVVSAEGRLHGAKAHSTLRCEVEMAVLRAEMGEVDAAAAVLRGVLETQSEHYPDARADQANTRTVLAETLVRGGRVDEAVEVLEPAVKFVRASQRLGNPVRLRVELARASCLSARGRVEDMKPSLREIVEQLEMTFGSGHPFTERGRDLLVV